MKARNVISAFKRIHPKLAKSFVMEIRQKDLVTELVRETEFRPCVVEKWLPTLVDLGYIQQVGSNVYRICYHPDVAGVFDDPNQMKIVDDIVELKKR